MYCIAHSSSYIIRYLHIPKEPLQPQHDLDWHRDVMNTIKTKQNKTMQSNAEKKAKRRAKQRAKQRQPYSYSYSSYH